MSWKCLIYINTNTSQQLHLPLILISLLFSSGYLANAGKENPPFCHEKVPTFLDDCCDTIDTSCAGTKFEDIESCCGVPTLSSCNVDGNAGDFSLDTCCKPFDCPTGCWYCQWKYAIFLQVCLLLPLCAIVIFTPGKYFQTNKTKDDTIDEEGAEANQEEKIDSRNGRKDSLWQYIEGGKDASNVTVWTQVRILWRSRVFVWTSLGLSALYFVVSGIQFWITNYLVEVLHVSYAEALSAFTVVSATGPVLGVIFGGWLVDYLGGYKGAEGVARTTKIILTFGVLSILVSTPAMFVTKVSIAMVLIWLLLFFGGASKYML